ncbi:MAG TPA: DUF3015 domain-containing protein [Gammaproteobacteria bacterium]|nr:DUF3015 domain-containing protein [Gammaproteobacteria bacterium]
MGQIIKFLTLVLVLFSVVSCAAFTEVSSSTSSTVDTVTPDVTLNSFVEQRYVAIREDAANGGGENLDALAHLLGKADRRAFAQFMQADFDRIFTDVDQPVDILARINTRALNKDS